MNPTLIQPELLTAIEASDAPRYLLSDLYLLQHKYDGVRRLIVRTPDSLTGLNKKGQPKAPAKAIAAETARAKYAEQT